MENDHAHVNSTSSTRDGGGGEENGGGLLDSWEQDDFSPDTQQLQKKIDQVKKQKELEQQMLEEAERLRQIQQQTAMTSEPPSAFKILRRPESVGNLQNQFQSVSVTDAPNAGDASSSEMPIGLLRRPQGGSQVGLKSLEEREKAYQEARQRIFGAQDNPETTASNPQSNGVVLAAAQPRKDPDSFFEEYVVSPRVPQVVSQTRVSVPHPSAVAVPPVMVDLTRPPPTVMMSHQNDVRSAAPQGYGMYPQQGYGTAGYRGPPPPTTAHVRPDVPFGCPPPSYPQQASTSTSVVLPSGQQKQYESSLQSALIPVPPATQTQPTQKSIGGQKQVSVPPIGAHKQPPQQQQKQGGKGKKKKANQAKQKQQNGQMSEQKAKQQEPKKDKEQPKIAILTRNK